MPAFLRSEGPFSVYDHSLRYSHNNPTTAQGDETITDKATLAAVKRHEDDLNSL